MKNYTSETTEQSVDTLNSFLRGEISAVETYRQAIEKLDNHPLRQQLKECQRSHQMRVEALRQWIRQLGGTPSESSGAWGAFAKLIEGGAKVFGVSSAIAALEEGEDHGRNDYRRDLDQLDAESRRFIENQILPEQERTHNLLSSYKKMLD
jgi:uncharacterized protein (TIGR02284 family)